MGDIVDVGNASARKPNKRRASRLSKKDRGLGVPDKRLFNSSYFDSVCGSQTRYTACDHAKTLLKGGLGSGLDGVGLDYLGTAAFAETDDAKPRRRKADIASKNDHGGKKGATKEGKEKPKSRSRINYTQGIYAEVVREAPNGNEGTMGKLTWWNNNRAIFTCRTLELPDLQNQSDISCIPLGTYRVTARRVGGFAGRAKSKWGMAFVPWVRDVPDRKYILVHWGSLLRATKGCLLVGKTAGVHDGENAVWHSQETFKRMYEAIEGLFPSHSPDFEYPFIVRSVVDEDEDDLTLDRTNI